MPNFKLDVPKYEGVLRAEWDDGFQIVVHVRDGQVYIQANKAGLRSLARLLLGLTVDGVQDWYHWHLDAGNSLEDGSVPLTIGRLPEE